jgi:transcriptional regulator with XRE-family HTH domain
MARRPLTTAQRAEGLRLASALVAARKAVGLSQQALSTQSGVALDSVRAIEHKRVPGTSFVTVARLARSLDIDLNELARETLNDVSILDGGASSADRFRD